MLAALVKAHPDTVENHCRLAQAYIVQGDRESALPYLCTCVRRKAELRHDEHILVDELVKESNNPQCPTSASSPSHPGSTR
jgi:hypothetical protein